MKEQKMWLARDKDDMLLLYTGEKPYKNARYWYSNDCFFFRIPRHLYPEVQWSDEEPTKVKLIIEKDE